MLFEVVLFRIIICDSFLRLSPATKGNLDKPPPKVKKPPSVKVGKSPGRRKTFVVLTDDEEKEVPAGGSGSAFDGSMASDSAATTTPSRREQQGPSVSRVTVKKMAPAEPSEEVPVSQEQEVAKAANAGHAAGSRKEVGKQRGIVYQECGEGNSGGGGPAARSSGNKDESGGESTDAKVLTGGRAKKVAITKLGGLGSGEELMTPARTPQGSSARVAALAAAKAVEAAEAAAAKAAEAAAARARAESRAAKAAKAAVAGSDAARGLTGAGSVDRGKQRGADSRETGGVGVGEEEDEDEMLSRTRSAPDAAILRALRSRLEKWREDNSKSVEQVSGVL